MNAGFLTNEEIVRAARRNLPQAAWDYLVGGSESETTMRRNRQSFDRLAFRPRMLVDVSQIDTSTTLLGHRLRIPVMLAPVGGLQRFTPDGGVAATQAAAAFGTLHGVSSVTDPSLEQIADAGDNPKIFQLYILGDWSYVEAMVGRVKQAGYSALCITVDSAKSSRRERPMVQRTAPVRGTGPFSLPYLAQVTWDTVDRIRDLAGLPFILKGIATAEDATLAVEHGVDVVWVSNHGGRQLDHALGTMDTLPEIVDAVAGRAQIVVDGGVQRGSDVIKAIALGANAVAIGKLQGWGLGAGGMAGLVSVLEILEDEIITAMGLLGVSSVSQLGPAYIAKADPVGDAHEMSSWINMPGGRLM